MVTPENEMKIDATEPYQNQFTYGNADRIVNHARSQRHAASAATPWPGTRSSPAGCRTCPAPRCATPCSTTSPRSPPTTAGKIYAWDVVNEAFADGGSGGRRDSNLQRTGNDWIEAAFRAARAADPGAKLCYNDYNTDDWIDAKTPGRLRHGPGLQGPRRADRLRRLPVALQRRLAVPEQLPGPTCSSFAALGVDVQITELDIAGSAHQADAYANVVQRLPGRRPLHRHHRVGHPRQRLLARRREPAAVRRQRQQEARLRRALNALNSGATHPPTPRSYRLRPPRPRPVDAP